LVVIHELSERITLSGTWVYGTGSAITLPMGTYPANVHDPFENIIPSGGFYNFWNEVSDYGDVNSFRMKAYHRMDLAIQFHKKLERYERTWEIGLYNAYNRKNPFFYFVETGYNENTNTEYSSLKQVSIFPVIPSITFNIKF
jgi:hypothetical protein